MVTEEAVTAGALALAKRNNASSHEPFMGISRAVLEAAYNSPSASVKHLKEAFKHFKVVYDPPKGVSINEATRRKAIEVATSAISAQVQDVAEVSPVDYMRRHDAAITAYEANTPNDHRYSALALRKAVDAAFAVAAAPAKQEV